MKWLYPLGFIALTWSCTSPSPNKFDDKVLATIYDLRDRRLGDSLAVYLTHANPIYRAEAALAFASVQDSTFSPKLGNLVLDDPSAEVRTNAAFALGQTPGYASVNALVPALSDQNPVVVREALEALGKTISTADLQQLKNFAPKDSLAEEGLAYAIYRLGLRNLADDDFVGRATQLLNAKYSNNTRMVAAHFFARGNAITPAAWPALAQAVQSDKNVMVRMAAVSGLRKIATDSSLTAVTACLTDRDYRVRANAVRALQSFKQNTGASLYQALSDSNVNVAIAAAEVLRHVSWTKEAQQLKEHVQATPHWRVRCLLLESIIVLDTTYLSTAKDLYAKAGNEYEKAWMLGAMAKSPHSFSFIAREALAAKALVIKTSGAQALAELATAPGQSTARKQQLARAFENLIGQGDAGAIGVAASALANPVLDFKSMVKDFSFLTEAKSKLSLPKDIETLQPLEEAIAYFEGGEKPMPPKNTFNHAIHWDDVTKVASDQQVIIKTTKGDITLQLLVNEAPGSVINFIDLVKKNYFNNRFFHRVVPNFVVQTGCNRGDGYGSEDYSIRSEFSRVRYREGSVGMASAGKDTEGTQWFITHSPTPHLDGRYTIFAEVLTGMEVVHRIAVGDRINEVILLEK